MWRRGIYALINSDLLPEGHRLRHSGRDRGDLVISVIAVEQAPRAAPKLAPIPVPDSLRGCHPIIRATKDAAKANRDGWIDTLRIHGVAHLRVHRASLQRSLLVLQGVVGEAERRGYSVVVYKQHGCEGGLGIGIRGHVFEVSAKEETHRFEHVLTASEASSKARGYHYGPRWDYVASGKLQLRDAHGGYSTALATDRKRWSLEERVPQLFVRLEEKAQIAEERQLEEARARERAQSAWEAAMARAEIELLEHHRREWLSSQLDAYRQARDTRELVALALARNSLKEEERTWLEWVRAHADVIDPLNRPLSPPTPPKPTPENLRPFLGGMSPYGPTGRW